MAGEVDRAARAAAAASAAAARGDNSRSSIAAAVARVSCGWFGGCAAGSCGMVESSGCVLKAASAAAAAGAAAPGFDFAIGGEFVAPPLRAGHTWVGLIYDNNWECSHERFLSAVVMQGQ